MREAITEKIEQLRSKLSLASDGARMTLAAIIASLVHLALISVLVDFFEWLPEETRTFPVDLFAWFFLYSAFYVALSQVAFGKLSYNQLRSKLKSTRPTDRSPIMAFIYGESGTSHATMFSFLALASVGIVALDSGESRDSTRETLLYAGALLTVVGAWVSNVASFAVQYAREDADANESEFTFPDTDKPVWSDYIYTALMVSAALSTGDVSARSRSRRKLVTINTVIAFTFNTVIIAILIAAIM